MDISLGGFGNTNPTNYKFKFQQENFGFKIPSILLAFFRDDIDKNEVKAELASKTNIEIFSEGIGTDGSFYLETRPSRNKVSKVYSKNSPLQHSKNILDFYRRSIDKKFDELYPVQYDLIDFNKYLSDVNSPVSHAPDRDKLDAFKAKAIAQNFHMKAQLCHVYLSNNKKFILIQNVTIRLVYTHKVTRPLPNGRNNRERNIPVSIRNHNAYLVLSPSVDDIEFNNLSMLLIEADDNRIVKSSINFEGEGRSPFKIESILSVDKTTSMTNQQFLDKVSQENNIDSVVFSKKIFKKNNTNIGNGSVNKSFLTLEHFVTNNFVDFYAYTAISKVIKKSNLDSQEDEIKKQYAYIISFFMLNKIMYAIYRGSESFLEDKNLLNTSAIKGIVTELSSLSTSGLSNTLQGFISIISREHNRNKSSLNGFLRQNPNEKYQTIFVPALQNNLSLAGILNDMFSQEGPTSVVEEMKLIYRLSTFIKELESPIANPNNDSFFTIDINRYIKDLVV